MTTKSKTAQRRTPRRKIKLERMFNAPIEDVWDLWTTAEGIESWWGPEGFTVKVRKLDLRVGGELLYAMTATGQAQVDFMKRQGLPLTQELRITYSEIVPRRRVAYTHVADFIPGVAPYDIETLVELHQTAQGVRMVLTIDAMHDEEWTRRAVTGWEMELEKLAGVLEG